MAMKFARREEKKACWIGRASKPLTAKTSLHAEVFFAITRRNGEVENANGAGVGDREIRDVRSTCCLQSAAAEPEAASTPVNLSAASLDRNPVVVNIFCAEGQYDRLVALRTF